MPPKRLPQENSSIPSSSTRLGLLVASCVANSREKKKNADIKAKDSTEVICESTSMKRSLESKTKEPKKIRFSQTNYDIEKIIEAKRNIHKNIVVSPINTNKAFSTIKSPPKATKSHPSRKDEVSKQISIDPTLLDILDWNVMWIKQTKNFNEPLPIWKNPLKECQLTYQSVEEYIETYKPLIYYEIWSQIIERLEATKLEQSFNSFILSYEMSGDFLRLDCFTPLRNSELSKHPTEGDLVVVELQVENSQKNGLVVFAYVQNVISEPVSKADINIYIYKIPPNSEVIVKCYLRMKFRPLKLHPTNSIKMRNLYYLKPMLRNIEAVLSLRNSKLCDVILKPKSTDLTVTLPTSVPSTWETYNESQCKVIFSASEAIRMPNNIPKLLLIQGPPGTGKTSTLLGIIKRLYQDWNTKKVSLKILLVTPSNGAIDEVARRLIAIKKSFKNTKLKRELKIIRLGQACQIHPDVKEIYIGDLASNDEDNNQLDNKTKSKMNSENDKRSFKYVMLKEADIVLTTLNSCRISLLESVFSPTGSTFNCVIVDEASQCSEPEILMPLMYISISKMILIGDPMQLPATVISKHAQKYGYGRSLFERIFTYFGSYSCESPVLMLNVQYRMLNEICAFPSHEFYGGRLKTHVSVKYDNCPLKPYLILELTDSNENFLDPKNIFNAKEARIVIKLFKTVDSMLDGNSSIGIITPYQGQKKLIQELINNENWQSKPEINTVDGFQGQEKDVIILSCVRSFNTNENNLGFLSSAQRLNVAITRARKCLILCISNVGFLNNSMWNNLISDAKFRNLWKRYHVKNEIDFKYIISKTY